MMHRSVFRGAAALLVCASAAWADDADEPNNAPAEAAACGRVGFLRTDRVLEVLDQDWYRFDVPATAGAVTVRVAYDGTTYDTLFTLEVQTLEGNLLASVASVGGSGVSDAVTAPLAAGSYLVCVRHDAGVALGNYSVHASVPNDGDEPNDSAAESASCGQVGFLRTNRVLAILDEDWYRFDVAAPTAGPVTVELSYDKSAHDTQFALDVQSLAGATLATGGPADDFGVARAVTAPLAAGGYRVRVRHVAGGAISSYSLHARVPNDADDPNDSEESAVSAGQAGFARRGLVLEIGDSDWYRFTLSAPVNSLFVDAVYDASAYPVTATLELKTATGALLATGSRDAATGILRASMRTMPAGDYLVSLRHTFGGAISAYTLQVYSGLTFSLPTMSESSASVPLDIPLAIQGGIKPYSVTIDSRFVSPPGITFDPAGPRLTGVPALAGRYEFMVTCRDAGAAANSVSALTTLIVNAQLDVRLGEFTAFARDRSAARALPSAGGTAPFTLETVSGALPHGVTLSGSSLAFGGSADEAASTAVEIKVTDAVGLSDTAATTAVVCSPLGTVELAEGDSACGAWFDAAQGSSITVSVTTAKKAAKRELRAVLLGADGTTALVAKVKTANGKAVLSGVTAPVSGRYYVVLASSEGAATSLAVSAKVTPSLKGAGREEDFASGDQLAVPFGAVAGSQLTFTAKSDAASELEVFVQALIDPSGAQVAFGGGDVVGKGGGFVFTTVLPKSGTWTILLAASRGGPGTLTYKFSLKLPRGAAFSVDGQ